MTGYSPNAFTGRCALVTGGGSGIGAAISSALAEAGCQVIIADRNLEEATQVADAVRGKAIMLDVADQHSVQHALGEIGAIDILINNAGVDQHAFFTRTGPADWSHLIQVNLIGVFACTHAVLPGMQDRKYGRIINIASEAARQGSKGGAVYAAAKGGVVAFTKSIARENARYGITANAVLPGPIRTRMLEHAVSLGGEKLRSAMVDSTLVGRLGEPQDVAAPVLMLASEAAGFITGEILGVSGGMGC